MKDWSCGYKKWLEDNPDATLSEKVQMIEKCSAQFDYWGFVNYYNNLSVDEWKKVIFDMANKGYDIRCVLHYKKLCGEQFTVVTVHEVFEPLLDANGVGDLVGFQEKFYVEPWEASGLRDSLIKSYGEWGLPIPQYWRNLLWT